jgi:PAS domain-containing protein
MSHVSPHAWVREFPAPITVTNTEGIIVEMNEAAIRQFAKSGGAALIGTNCLDCHPEPSRTEFARMLRSPRPNVYSIEKGGKKTIIYQTPWFQEGQYAGYIELSFEAPMETPHFVRG